MAASFDGFSISNKVPFMTRCMVVLCSCSKHANQNYTFAAEDTAKSKTANCDENDCCGAKQAIVM